MATYQSFEQPGDSASAEKLKRLRLPQRLDGLSVLDLGCNEGYFCIEAKRRGASYVLGVDNDPRIIAAARERAVQVGADVDYEVRSMEDLFDRKFDYIFLLSAIHYIDQPAFLLSKLLGHLMPNGVLVLELGVILNTGGKTVGRALRSIDERMYPTEALLTQVWLRGYSARRIGPSVAQTGDPIPRYVFHCTPANTNVIFIVGNGGIGKSTLAKQMSNAPLISTDELFVPLRYERHVAAPEQQKYDQIVRETGSIWTTWERIKVDPETKQYFVNVIVRAIQQCEGEELIILEGFVLRELVEDIVAKLGPSYRPWVTTRTGN